MIRCSWVFLQSYFSHSMLLGNDDLTSCTHEVAGRRFSSHRFAAVTASMAIGQREIAAIVLEFFVALLLSNEGSFHPIEAFEKLRALVVFCRGFAIVVMLLLSWV